MRGTIEQGMTLPNSECSRSCVRRGINERLVDVTSHADAIIVASILHLRGYLPVPRIDASKGHLSNHVPNLQ